MEGNEHLVAGAEIAVPPAFRAEHAAQGGRQLSRAISGDAELDERPQLRLAGLGVPGRDGFAQHWNCDDGTIEEFGQARDALHQHCAEIGRDPRRSGLSAQARFGGDPASTSATAAAYAQAGAQLLIISLPPPHTPAVLEPLATALRELC